MASININLPPRAPGPLANVLRAIGREVEMSRAALSSPIHEHDVFDFPDPAALTIDGFLGAAFVSCQTYIATTIALVNCVRGMNGAPAYAKQDILRMGIHVENPPRYSRYQLIDGFANYFKHRDEWDPNWMEVDKRSRPTVDLIQSVGADPQFADNMLRGAKAAEMDDFLNLEAVALQLADWSHEIINKVRIASNSPSD